MLLSLSLALPVRADVAEARQLFEAAQQDYAVGDYARALEAFTAAYQSKPLSPLLFNIAQCHRQLGQWAQADFFYSRFLEAEPDSPDAPTARALQQEVRTRVIQERGWLAAHRADVPPRAEPVDLKKGAARAAAGQPAPVLTKVEEAPRPVYRRPWFWAATGTAVVAASVTAFLLTRPTTPQGTLGAVDAR